MRCQGVGGANQTGRYKRTTTLHWAANLEREEKGGEEEEEDLTMETRPLYNLEEIRSCNETTARPADFEIMDVSVCTGNLVGHSFAIRGGPGRSWRQTFTHHP